MMLSANLWKERNPFLFKHKDNKLKGKNERVPVQLGRLPSQTHQQLFNLSLFNLLAKELTVGNFSYFEQLFFVSSEQLFAFWEISLIIF